MKNNGPFNLSANSYDEWFDKEGKIIFETEVCAFTRFKTSFPKPWVEIGIGSGRFASALGIQTGLDPSAQMLELCSGKGIKTFQGAAENQPFPSSAFGTAFFIVTVCFLHSPLIAFMETNRILAPLGKIVVGAVLKDSPWGCFYQQKKLEGHRFYKEATFYTYEQIRQFLKQSGFKIDNTVSTLYQKPGDVKHVEKPKNGYSQQAGFTVIIASKNNTDI